MNQKKVALISAVVLLSAAAVWWFISPTFQKEKPEIASANLPKDLVQNTPQVGDTSTTAVTPTSQLRQTSIGNNPVLSALTVDEIQNLSADVLIQSAKNAEEVFDYSESWYPNGTRHGCVREDSTWSFCDYAGGSQRALADPLKLSHTQRVHHETLLRYAKTYCGAFPKINARRMKDVAFDYRTRPFVREPFDLLISELLAISVTTPIQERQALATLAQAFQQSYCLRQVIPEVFIRLESTGYRKHLSYVTLIDELSSNEVVAAGPLAAELAACRSGPACGPMGFMTMQACQSLKNCKPEQTLFDIRRARTTPRVFQTAVEIANHYGIAELASKK